MAVHVALYEVAEIPLRGDRSSASLDVEFVDPAGRCRIVPGFLSKAGWHVRYSAIQSGVHRYRSLTPGAREEGEVHVASRPSASTNLAHGPIRVAEDRRHFEHADGTPFFWLADTWHHGFVTTKISDTDFKSLAAKRAAQGFSVVLISAGLPCELAPFSVGGASDVGWAWRPNFTELNPDWWEEADTRIAALTQVGLMPCIFGSWGYYLSLMSEEKIFRHWREMVARWGSFPVVWCLAGEPMGVWHDDIDPVVNESLRENPEQTLDQLVGSILPKVKDKVDVQLERLNAIAAHLKELNCLDRLVTTHNIPGAMPWTFLSDEKFVDFWFLQTGHEGHYSLEPSVNALNQALDHRPTKPAIVGECNFEGIGGASWQDTQRFLFWSHMLSGAAGHTYGAHGIWAFNTSEFPGQFSGLAPSWKEAVDFAGSKQVGLGRQILMSLPWHTITPHSDWIEPHPTEDDRLLPYAAGLASDSIRLIYFPSRSTVRKPYNLFRLCRLGTTSWSAEFVDPRTGQSLPKFAITPDADGNFALRGVMGWPLPSWEDWLLRLDRVDLHSGDR